MPHYIGDRLVGYAEISSKMYEKMADHGLILEYKGSDGNHILYDCRLGESEGGLVKIGDRVVGRVEIDVTKENRGYAIIRCNWCGHFLTTKTEWKSRTCPYCHNRLNPSMAKAYGFTEDEEGARIRLMEVQREYDGHYYKRAVFERASRLNRLMPINPFSEEVDYEQGI